MGELERLRDDVMDNFNLVCKRNRRELRKFTIMNGHTALRNNFNRIDQKSINNEF